ncbi:unnamed protein product [Parnassius mnemosyne]|uniref:Thyroglobulin type-1 domain-containing protein n=1 Tax=Parnassius mnemosyne TaxID=213953 RepID=A0AAV1LY87_9NEOP
MANRLLDWFSVLMEEAGGVAPPLQGFPRDCKPEVRWMFSHLDVAGDGLLSHDDLYALRHDERERCLRPFLASCGRARGGRGEGGRVLGGRRAGGGLSRGAWCGCLRRAARPCAALARAHPNPSAGAYVPACDARGFYLPRQCHAALGVCWCVDAHGVERPASRTKGQPACPTAGTYSQQCSRYVQPVRTASSTSTCRGSATRRSACAGAWTRTAWSGPPRAPRDSPPAPPPVRTASSAAGTCSRYVQPVVLLPAAAVPRGARRVLVRGRARRGAARLAHQGTARLPHRRYVQPAVQPVRAAGTYSQ